MTGGPEGAIREALGEYGDALPVGDFGVADLCSVIRDMRSILETQSRHMQSMAVGLRKSLEDTKEELKSAQDTIATNTKRLVDAGFGCAPNDEPYLLTAVVSLVLERMNRESVDLRERIRDKMAEGKWVTK
jgi:hypothetical protein